MLACFLQAKDPLDKYFEQGKNVGKQVSSQMKLELSPKEIESITPVELRGKNFDAEQACQEVKNYPTRPIEGIKQKDPDVEVTAFMTNAENAFEKEEKPIETMEKCLVESKIEHQILNHTLNVHVTYQPPSTRTARICLGHKSRKRSNHPRKDKHKKEKELSSDPAIKSYDIKIEESTGGAGHRDYIAAHWTHKDDTPQCDHFGCQVIETSPASWTETDTWSLENAQLLSNPNCTLEKVEESPQETRIIEGRPVTRSWRKTQHLKCITQQEKGCEFLKFKQCFFKKENCLKTENNHCLQLEKIFQCFSSAKKVSIDTQQAYGQDPQLWDTQYQPNQSFSDIATKLTLFDEMKKELQTGHAASLFKGIPQKCSVSIAENLMYDCCQDMEGLAVDLKLSKCTIDEIALAESKKKGLAHYIGKKDGNFANLWKSREDHLFCIFPTKLARIFQEQAREQLNINWGDAHDPDCRGLTLEEIKKLNFSKISLKEAFEEPKTPETQDKIQRIEERLKNKLKEA
jgi:conjugal transfer mating pair stabilization protein TraN